MTTLTPTEHGELVSLGNLSPLELRRLLYDYVPGSQNKMARQYSRGDMIALLFSLYLENKRPSRLGVRHDESPDHQ